MISQIDIDHMAELDHDIKSQRLAKAFDEFTEQVEEHKLKMRNIQILKMKLGVDGFNAYITKWNLKDDPDYAE